MARFSLSGRHVLITGAAGGIGSALAHILRERHAARLMLADRDLEGLQSLKSDLESASSGVGGIDLFEVDLASGDSIAGLVEQLGDRPLEVLINNAGIAPGGSFEGMTLEAVMAVLDINLHAVVALTHRLLPKLLNNERSAIANVASGAGLLGPAGLSAYAASKFGVVGFSEALRAELRGRVGVSTICPAFVKTNIIRNSLNFTGERGSADAEQIDKLDGWVHRMGISPERAARAVIKSIRKNRGRVVLPFLARFLVLFRFLLPAATGYISHRNYRKLQDKGILR